MLEETLQTEIVYKLFQHLFSKRERASFSLLARLIFFSPFSTLPSPANCLWVSEDANVLSGLLDCQTLEMSSIMGDYCFHIINKLIFQ